MSAVAILEAFRQAAIHHSEDEGWLYEKQVAFERNRWFTPENIDSALDQWLSALAPNYVQKWLTDEAHIDSKKDKTLGLILAGNIPFVGMHDVFCGLAAGMRLKIKVSSDDEVLPKFWIRKATEIYPDLKDRIEFTDSLKGIDAAIATGSNNSAKYFEYYFRNIPHILRKNRNSVSVLHGNEQEEMLLAVGKDVFAFYGLGCRNVTHLYLPEGYAFKPLFDAWEAYADIINHHKYANNYNYHKALLLLNLDPHMDTGYLLLKEKEDIYSPVGMLNYSFYTNLDEVKQQLKNKASEIQCITSDLDEITPLKLGQAQNTMLWDYADNVNTLAWLQGL